MKLALIGYGKMGKTLEVMAKNRGHEIPLVVDKNDFHLLKEGNLKEVDVAIEFSQPESAYNNIMACLQEKVPVVSGTTGWLDKLDEVRSVCLAQRGGFFYASNYSIGVNLFFALNKHLANIMNDHPLFDVSVQETHHTHKLDAPSGTAITLAEDLIDQIDRKVSWTNDSAQHSNEVEIISKRINDVPGIHSIIYSALMDTIEIKHTSHSREGFAKGALIAAEWLKGRTGCFTMKDLLGF